MATTIEQRAISAAYQALKTQGYVSAIDVFMGMGVLSKEHYENWRKGQIPYLEKVIQGNLSKISRAMKAFRSWARQQNLNPRETVYLKWGRGCKFELRFSKRGHPQIEIAYRTHFVSPRLREESEKRKEAEKLKKSKTIESTLSSSSITDGQAAIKSLKAY